MITDENKKILSVNPAFTEITGYTEEEAIGKTPRLLKSDRHEEQFYHEMWSVIEGSGRWQGELWDRRKNGEIFPVWQTISAVKDGYGEAVNYVSVLSDISSIKQSQAQLDFLAYHDPLTSLPNRLLFNDRLAHALKHARRESSMVAVLFIDLDRFKYFNDSFGHLVGDKLIQQAAQRLADTIRDDDTVARQGGDEFIIAMESIKDERDVLVMAEKLVTGFQEPIFVDGYELHVTLSIGVSIYPRDGVSSEALIKHADTAMYQAKEEGRNHYHLYTSELTASVYARLSMEAELRHALEQGELLMHYQPQYALQDGALVGLEALLRWQRSSGEWTTPAGFIALAEECGLAEPLGEWVLSTVCLQLQHWRQAGFEVPRMAMNVSALYLQSGGFASTITRALEESGLPPQCLELEMTENTIMRKAESTIGILDQLSTLGVAFAIDDFGSGKSSLNLLERMPLSRLKIDRSFVRDIQHDPHAKVITQTVISLAHNLHLSVIAEGVETGAQAALLREQGCDEVQGHLYSRAVSAGAVAMMLQ